MLSLPSSSIYWISFSLNSIPSSCMSTLSPLQSRGCRRDRQSFGYLSLFLRQIFVLLASSAEVTECHHHETKKTLISCLEPKLESESACAHDVNAYPWISPNGSKCSHKTAWHIFDNSRCFDVSLYLTSWKTISQNHARSRCVETKMLDEHSSSWNTSSVTATKHCASWQWPSEMISREVLKWASKTHHVHTTLKCSPCWHTPPNTTCVWITNSTQTVTFTMSSYPSLAQWSASKRTEWFTNWATNVRPSSSPITLFLKRRQCDIDRFIYDGSLLEDSWEKSSMWNTSCNKRSPTIVRDRSSYVPIASHQFQRNTVQIDMMS